VPEEQHIDRTAEDERAARTRAAVVDERAARTRPAEDERTTRTRTVEDERAARMRQAIKYFLKVFN